MGIFTIGFWTYKFYKAPHKKASWFEAILASYSFLIRILIFLDFPRTLYAGWSSHSWSLGHLWMLRRPELRKTFGIHFVRSVQNKRKLLILFRGWRTRSFILTTSARDSNLVEKSAEKLKFHHCRGSWQGYWSLLWGLVDFCRSYVLVQNDNTSTK